MTEITTGLFHDSNNETRIAEKYAKKMLIELGYSKKQFNINWGHSALRVTDVITEDPRSLISGLERTDGKLAMAKLWILASMKKSQFSLYIWGNEGCEIPIGSERKEVKDGYKAVFHGFLSDNGYVERTYQGI